MNATSAVTLALLCLILIACGPKRPPKAMQTPTPEKRLYVLKHRLELTDEQVTTIRPIIEDHIEKKKEILDDFDPDEKEFREKMEDLQWNTIKALSKHLSEEQMHLYSDLLQEEEEAMETAAQSQDRPRGGKRGGPPRR